MDILSYANLLMKYIWLKGNWLTAIKSSHLRKQLRPSLLVVDLVKGGKGYVIKSITFGFWQRMSLFQLSVAFSSFIFFRFSVRRLRMMNIKKINNISVDLGILHRANFANSDRTEPENWQTCFGQYQKKCLEWTGYFLMELTGVWSLFTVTSFVLLA